MLRLGMIGAGMVSQHHLLGCDIAAPREHHAELTRLGVARGLAVLCQKPLAPTLAEAEALVAETRGARLMVHENWRFCRYYRDAARWPERRLLVNEVLFHHLDTLRVLLGGLTVVSARVGRTCAEVVGEQSALIGMRAASGAGVVLFGNLAAHGSPPGQGDNLLITRTAGTIRLRGNRLEPFGAEPEAIEDDMADCYQGSYDAVIAHFVDCVRNATAFEITTEDNLHRLRLVESAYRLAARPPAS